jgi:ATP-dependent RNA helicase SUPV3L1/SUV3
VCNAVIPRFAEFVTVHSGAAIDGKVHGLDESMRWAANLTGPHELYPLARSLKRRVVIHTGPTNSGKTFHALKRMSAALSGLYTGPLRLLAWEVQEKLTAMGVPTNLLTGQELIELAGARHVSSTVEMLNVNTVVDVGVIDEMQMIGGERGDAWTRALFGMAAREVHVCCDASAVPLIEEMCSITKEPFEIHTYRRLNQLRITKPVQQWNRIEPYGPTHPNALHFIARNVCLLW